MVESIRDLYIEVKVYIDTNKRTIEKVLRFDSVEDLEEALPEIREEMSIS